MSSADRRCGRLLIEPRLGTKIVAVGRSVRSFVRRVGGHALSSGLADILHMLVAELGLYGVRPDLEGLGVAQSIHILLQTLQEFRLPFAFGTIRNQLRKHIERFGRHGLVTVMPGISVRSTLPHARTDLPPTRVEDPLVIALPVGRRCRTGQPSG